jgi:hypothetical protein
MDPLCFLWKDEQRFFETCRNRKEHFAPQPCPYIRFQHGDVARNLFITSKLQLKSQQDTSNIKITQGELVEDSVLDFVKSPRDTGYHFELRLLYDISQSSKNFLVYY